MNIEGGVQSAGGERSANFARRALAEKGGYFAAAACQLAAFSRKIFSDWSIGISLESLDTAR